MPSFFSMSSVFIPTILEPWIFISRFVSPPSTGTALTYGSPSIKGMISFVSISLNSFTVFTSRCANTYFCASRRFALASYWASWSVICIASSRSPVILSPFPCELSKYNRLCSYYNGFSFTAQSQISPILPLTFFQK